MPDVPPDLAERLHAAGQEHVLHGWDALDDDRRAALVGQLRAVDLLRLAGLYAKRDAAAAAVPPADRLAPLPVAEPAELPVETAQRGVEALRRGEVAVLMVAGGQGSRLGFEHPKGMFPVGPVTNKTLFQIHAEKVLALARRYGKPVPFLVMTSPATHSETVDFFLAHHNFGLPREDVFFFQQGTMPALDLQTGRLLLDEPGRLFLSPNGHGGTLTALADAGLIDRLRGRGVRHIFYFQVDNPLVKVADPVFLGHHIARAADVSVKVIYKEYPAEKMGVFVLIDGRCGVIEYSDLPTDLAEKRDAAGNLLYRAGNPAVHIFDLAFLDRVTAPGGVGLPFHLARKKVPHFDTATGQSVTPTKENALKFEMFVFDALPLADRWTALATTRAEEFVPLKNATGADSPATVRQALSNLAGVWLEGAGVQVPRDAEGNVTVPLEVSPLAALAPGDLFGQVEAGKTIDGPTYVG